jgi:hypothetical protein
MNPRPTDLPDDDPHEAEELAAGRYAAQGYEEDPYAETGGRPVRPPRRPFGGLNFASIADDFLDELLPEEIDWRRLVGTYPKTSLTLAAVAGYMIGRSQGRALVNRASGLAMGEVRRVVQDTVGDLFEE